MIGSSKILELSTEGFSVKEIAERLCLDVGVVQKALDKVAQESMEGMSIDEMLEQQRMQAVNTLVSVMRDGENETARVRAAQVILATKPVMTTDNLKVLEERLRQMKMITERSREIQPVMEYTGETCLAT